MLVQVYSFTDLSGVSFPACLEKRAGPPVLAFPRSSKRTGKSAQDGCNLSPHEQGLPVRQISGQNCSWLRMEHGTGWTEVGCSCCGQVREK